MVEPQTKDDPPINLSGREGRKYFFSNKIDCQTRLMRHLRQKDIFLPQGHNQHLLSLQDGREQPKSSAPASGGIKH